MKKLAVLLVVVLLATSLLAPAAMADGLALSWWGNQTRNERTIAALDLFKTETGIEFDGQFNAWADYWEKLKVAAAGNALPAVVQMDYQYLLQYVNDGLLVDLTPYVESGALDVSGINAGILESGSVDGGLYAICIGVNAPSMFYNKTLLDSVGITVKDNMTWDEFYAICREVYEKTGYKTNFSYGSNQTMDYYLRGVDKQLYVDGKLGVTAEDLVDFYKFFETGIAEGWHLTSEVYAETTIGSVEQDPMVYGSSPDTMSWCALMWSNQLVALQAAAPEGMEIGITTWPSVDPQKSNYLKPSQFFSVTRDASDLDAAVSLVNFWTNSVEANKILLGERGIPAASAVADGIADLLDDQNKMVIAYINNVVSPNCSAISAPEPAAAAEFYAVTDEMMEYLCYGAMTAEEAAAQTVEAAQSIFN